ncbi:MAG TPA: hypothetical protein VHG33_04765 [Woeseiaceae bacterium]|nr:hypothetical protein [Woeseiaceae bacterium]
MSTGESAELQELRARIAELLALGLETEIEPFPITEKEFAEILTRLRALEPENLEAKLIIGGFKDYPHGPDNWRCADCIYYLARRKWCDLPELAVPVEADWYCRLWRM